eukprot:3864830-Pyramimonas_sp.AAC.1
MCSKAPPPRPSRSLQKPRKSALTSLEKCPRESKRVPSRVLGGPKRGPQGPEECPQESSRPPNEALKGPRVKVLLKGPEQCPQEATPNANVDVGREEISPIICSATQLLRNSYTDGGATVTTIAAAIVCYDARHKQTHGMLAFCNSWASWI